MGKGSLMKHMKLLVNKRSLIFPVITPTVDLAQNIRNNCSFSFRYHFIWRFMTSYLRNSKITRLTHIFSFLLLSIAAKNPRTLVITFGKLSVFYKTHKHGRTAREGEGGCSPPKFWATQIFWAARENLFLKTSPCLFYYFEDLNINLKSA